MRQNDDCFGLERMDYDAWRAMLRPLCGRYNVEGVEPDTFAGSLRALSVSGLKAVDICGNARRYQRTRRDVRLDDLDHYKAVFQVAGQSTVHQNDQSVQLAVGDVVLVDATRPMTCVCEHGSSRWLLLALPRRSLVSHLGFEPQGGTCRRGGIPAGRLLYEIALDALKGDGSACPPVDSYMQLAVYDLLGALFAPADPPPSSRHAHKLFTRIRALIKDRFADPAFGPAEAASAAGISLRYLQKLFTQGGSTFTEFIYSLRLDHAARLLDRRTLLAMSDPISTIAYDCGFRDYTHFARKFRHRFGYSPGAHSRTQRTHDVRGLVRANPVDSTRQAHDDRRALI
jgi:AraC family transcriptional activator of tynA and feaB